MAAGNVHTFEPGWTDMGYVEACVRARYGDNASRILDQMRQRELRRHASSNLMVHTIGRGQDCFQRNLRALEYIAQGHTPADELAVKQLYTDAAADLKSIYPPGVKASGADDLHEVWKHVLDAKRDEAMAKCGRRGF